MLFIRSPHDVYYDIYSLVKLGFTAEYVESISPAERELFKSYYKMEEESNNTESNENAMNAVGLNSGDF